MRAKTNWDQKDETLIHCCDKNQKIITQTGEPLSHKLTVLYKMGSKCFPSKYFLTLMTCCELSSF